MNRTQPQQYAPMRSARRRDAEAAVDLSTWRRWYTEGDGSGNNASPDGTPPASTNEGAGGSGGEEKKLSQQEANKLIGEARKKGRDTAMADLLKELGYETIDEAKSKTAAAREREEAEKSEAQKAAEAKERAEQEAARLKDELERERISYRLERRDNALLAALRDAGATDEENNPRSKRVLTLLKDERGADVEALLGEDGAVDAAKLKKLVADAETAYADFFGASLRTIPGTVIPRGRPAEPGKAAREDYQRKTAQRLRG